MKCEWRYYNNNIEAILPNKKRINVSTGKRFQVYCSEGAALKPTNFSQFGQTFKILLAFSPKLSWRNGAEPRK